MRWYRRAPIDCVYPPVVTESNWTVLHGGCNPDDPVLSAVDPDGRPGWQLDRRDGIDVRALTADPLGGVVWAETTYTDRGMVTASQVKRVDEVGMPDWTAAVPPLPAEPGSTWGVHAFTAAGSTLYALEAAGNFWVLHRLDLATGRHLGKAPLEIHDENGVQSVRAGVALDMFAYPGGVVLYDAGTENGGARLIWVDQHGAFQAVETFPRDSGWRDVHAYGDGTMVLGRPELGFHCDRPGRIARWGPQGPLWDHTFDRHEVECRQEGPGTTGYRFQVVAEPGGGAAYNLGWDGADGDGRRVVHRFDSAGRKRAGIELRSVSDAGLVPAPLLTVDAASLAMVVVYERKEAPCDAEDDVGRCEQYVTAIFPRDAHTAASEVVLHTAPVGWGSVTGVGAANDRIVVVGSRDGSLGMWQVRDGSLTRPFPGLPSSTPSAEPVPDTRPGPCDASVYVIGVRGSGESAVEPTPTSDPVLRVASMGHIVTDFYERLRGRLVDGSFSAAWEGLAYPAPPVFGKGGSARSFGWRYWRSIEQGQETLVRRIAQRQKACPDQPLVLAGYSQGAHVVGTVIERELSGSPLREGILAAVLFADPRMNPNDPAVHGTAFVGVPPGTVPVGILGRRDLFPDWAAGKLRSYCLAKDVICTSYGNTEVHTDDYTRATTDPVWPVTTQAAADFVNVRVINATLQRVQQVHPQTGDGPTASAGGPYRTRPGQPVMIGANASLSSGGGALSFAWDLDADGKTDRIGSVPTTTAVFAQPGPYQVTVVVTDESGLTDEATATVDVDTRSPVPPNAPDGLTAQQHGTTTVLRWDAPTETGGAALHSYRLEDSETDRLLGIVTEPEAVLQDVEARSVHVRAVNEAGAGPASVSVRTVPTAVDDAAGGVQRAAGAGRAGTAVALSRRSYPLGANDVVLSRADAYADALAAAPLAGALGAPVLLTERGRLLDEVAAEAGRLGATQAHLIGGESALGPAVEASLRALGLTVERISGPSRYATAAEVARRLGGHEAILVKGADQDPRRGWQDAVSASAWAAATGRPILLSETDRLPDETAAALASLGVASVSIVGGPSAVDPSVAQALVGLGIEVQRISGADRYATSALVAARSVKDGLSSQVVLAATGGNYPDALAAGPAAAALGSPLLLIDGADAQGGSAATSWLSQQSPMQVLVAGGSAAITEPVVRRLDEIATR